MAASVKVYKLKTSLKSWHPLLVVSSTTTQVIFNFCLKMSAAILKGYLFHTAIFWLFLEILVIRTSMVEKLSFWLRRRAVEFLLLRLLLVPLCEVIGSLGVIRIRSSVAQNFTLKKRGGEISQKTQNFGPTWTPDPLIESSHKSGHKNGTFTALNKGERHEFCAKLFYIKQKRNTLWVYRQTKQVV